MNASCANRSRLSLHRLFRRALAVVAVLASSVAVYSPPSASAASLLYRVDLKVLVLDDGSGPVGAIKSQMQVEGVPFTSVNIATANITNAFLTGSANLATATRSLYQAVVVPDYSLAALSAAERQTLRDYEARFGIRQVDVYNYPASAIGMNTPVFAGDFNGVTANMTVAGKAAGFGYLNGPVPFSLGSWTYVATPLAVQAAGATFTPLVESQPPGGGVTGSLLGVYSSGGVEQMVITAAFDFTFPQFKYLGHGIITWMTRGVHFGYNRNNFTFHVDDAFANIALWDPTADCTPGEDCTTGTERTVRMTVDDVAYAVAWMQANNYQLTLAFNGSYAYNTDGDANPDPDPLADALRASQASFRWLNHGAQHLYQGCQQTGTLPWACVLNAGNPVWVTEQTILDEINNNIATGVALGLTFDHAEYLSGEHSGLAHNLPTDPPTQQHPDNPNFLTALTAAGINYIGSDASREASSRQVGSATTIPRHPTALYYNTSTQTDAVDEYNHIYSLSLDPATGFTSYIVPTDAAFDLSFILSNDPRPFYAHTSNLTGDRLAYFLLDAILGNYRTVFSSAAPVVNLTLTGAATQLARQQQWATDISTVTGYVQNGVVTISNSTGHAVPFTAPAGATIVGTTFESYGGESSAWLTAGPKTGTLPAPTLVTTGGTFLVGQVGTMTLSVASTPTATVLASGTLPSGLSYTATPGGITISGTPGAGTYGTYPITVTVVTAGYNNLETVNLIVARAASFSSASSATGVAGNPFTFTVTTTSGIPAPAITITSGSLPTGITLTDLGNGTATLAGTPALSTGGQSFPITLTATNAGGVTNQPFILTVHSVPAFTSATSAVAVAGSPFSFVVSTVGSPAPVITMAGSLPAGITFSAPVNGTATLSGTAAAAAAGQSFPITLTATNDAGAANQAFTLTVTPDQQSLPPVPANPSLKSITPARLADTRPGFKTVDGLYEGEGIRATGSTMKLLVTGRGGVPADAAAVALNVTVAEPVGAGYVTVHPCGSDQPLASNLNYYTAGAVVPNAVIAKIGDDGMVCLFVSNSTQLIVDVNGYFPATSSFSSMNPARLLDTRPGFTTVDGVQQGEGVRERTTVTTLQVTGRAGVPADAAAVVLNVTVTEAAGPGFVTVYPCGSDIPTASSLNFSSGSTIANMVIAKIGDNGTVCLYNNESTHIVVDVNGYFPALTNYSSLTPARVLDTRPGFTTIDGQFVGEDLRPSNWVTELTVTNRGGVPAEVSTVVLNVTVTEPTIAGFVTVYPCGIGVPLASNLNYEAGSTVAIAVIVQVPSTGKVCLYNSAPTQLIADVNGYIVK